MTRDASELLTPAEAAAYLRLSKSTLAKLRCVGGGPRFKKLGRKIVYARADLDAWLAARTAANTTDAGARLPRRLIDAL